MPVTLEKPRPNNPADTEKTFRMRPRKTEKSASSLSNHEIVVVAAFLAGAQSTSVDTEDIAVKANELAPGRFTWRKYKEQINIDTVRKRLWDATKVEKGAYLIGSERTGWRLTKAGFDFARKRRTKSVLAQPRKPRASQIERSAQTRELVVQRKAADETRARAFGAQHFAECLGLGLKYAWAGKVDARFGGQIGHRLSLMK